MLQAAFQLCLLILHSVQGMQYTIEQQKLPLDYCINTPGQSQQVIALQKAYHAEMKLPFSNEDNAEPKMKTSSQGKQCYVPRTAAQVERKQMKMSGEVQGQVELSN